MTSRKAKPRSSLLERLDPVPVRPVSKREDALSSSGVSIGAFERLRQGLTEEITLLKKQVDDISRTVSEFSGIVAELSEKQGSWVWQALLHSIELAAIAYLAAKLYGVGVP